MSLYTHVRNKNDLLDGVADAVISEIPLSADGDSWKTSLRQMALAARTVMLRHTWAPRTIETRTAARTRSKFKRTARTVRRHTGDPVAAFQPPQGSMINLG